VVATLLAHHFWAGAAEQQAMQTIQFMKNLAIVGRLLAVVAPGAGRRAVWRTVSGSVPDPEPGPWKRGRRDSLPPSEMRIR
jgi:hypothetical protein